MRYYKTKLHQDELKKNDSEILNNIDNLYDNADYRDYGNVSSNDSEDEGKSSVNNNIYGCDDIKSYETDDNLDDGTNYYIKKAKKEGVYLFEERSSYLLLYITIFWGIGLFLLIGAALPGRNPSKIAPYIAPLYIWIIDLVFLALSVYLLKGYSSRYYLDLKKQKLVKEYSLYSFHKKIIIADFKEIKLIGVSTIVSLKEKFNSFSGISYSYETIAVYGTFNKVAVLEREDNFKKYSVLSKFNDIPALAVSKIIGCKFIPCDDCSKLIIKKGYPEDDIESLIVRKTIDQQLPNVKLDDDSFI